MEVLEFMEEINYSSICGNDGLLIGPFATSYCYLLLAIFAICGALNTVLHQFPIGRPKRSKPRIPVNHTSVFLGREDQARDLNWYVTRFSLRYLFTMTVLYTLAE